MRYICIYILCFLVFREWQCNAQNEGPWNGNQQQRTSSNDDVQKWIMPQNVASQSNLENSDLENILKEQAVIVKKRKD